MGRVGQDRVNQPRTDRKPITLELVAVMVAVDHVVRGFVDPVIIDRPDAEIRNWIDPVAPAVFIACNIRMHRMLRGQRHNSVDLHKVRQHDRCKPAHGMAQRADRGDATAVHDLGGVFQDAFDDPVTVQPSPVRIDHKQHVVLAVFGCRTRKFVGRDIFAILTYTRKADHKARIAAFVLIGQQISVGAQ